MSQSVNTTLMAVAIGGIIGFFSAFYLETARRQYELKKQVYLEALDTFSEATKFWAKGNEKGIRVMDDDFYYASFKLQSTIYKVLLCGCSKEVYDLLDSKFTERDSFKEPKKVHSLIINELIPAFEKDLKRWWMPWR